MATKCKEWWKSLTWQQKATYTFTAISVVAMLFTMYSTACCMLTVHDMQIRNQVHLEDLKLYSLRH